MAADPVDTYVSAVRKALERGDATEHTHRPALKTLLESLKTGIAATNEPSRRTDVGAPDMIVCHGKVPVGYVETKDVGTDLQREAESEQLRRYRNGLPNLILTDYIEFHLYRNGELALKAALGSRDKKGKISGIDPRDCIELITEFLSATAKTVGKPRDLAKRLGDIAHIAREVILKAVTDEHEKGPLHAQMEAFREVLLQDLDPEDFADMYAQTIAYGLFAAKCSPKSRGAFTREGAAYLLPRTNPFLRKVFNHIAGPELDERVVWIVEELVSLLNHCDMAAILKDFGRRTRQDDPVVHFYEDFLSEYDPRMRESRGVYYTPEPVVSYIVRSVDLILQKEFGILDGLADSTKIRWRPKGDAEEIETHRLHVLDPALGTGTFLYFIIQEIYLRFQKNKGLWPGYVREHLLPRIHGFELLMAPYAVAHMKLGILLEETGYDFASDDRLGVYLTNSLEEAFKNKFETRLPFADWLQEEANAASNIKRDYPVMVVLGNPPYSGHSANRSKDDSGAPTFIGKLLDSYYFVDGQPLGEGNPKWLQDDYVKFFRFAQDRIERTGRGILAFVTNHGYLDNPTFRGMRQSLMDTFDKIYILDLHGNARKQERTPEGGPDKNVFDIQQGVALAIMVKTGQPSGNAAEASQSAGGAQ